MSRYAFSPKNRSVRRQQRGAAMWVITMLSVLLGLIAMSQVNSLVSMFHGARDERDVALARQAAEAALRDAEADIVCMRVNAGTWQRVIVPDTPNEYCTSLLPHCSQLMPSVDAPGLRVLGSNPSAAPAPVNWAGDPAACKDGNCSMVLGTKTGAKAIAGVAAQPRYQIDVFDASTGGTAEPVPLFRITARGFGGNSSTMTELQEVYRPCR